MAIVVLLILAGCVVAYGTMQDWFADRFIGWMAVGLLWVSAPGVFFGEVLAGLGEAPCPACGARLTGLEPKGQTLGILCTGCGMFLQSKHGRIEPTEPNAVADEPCFGALLPASAFQWPPGCVVCGEPPTQALPLDTSGTDANELIKTAAVAAGGVLGAALLVQSGKSLKLYVPHCSAHDDGARLENLAGGRISIFFRSLAYQRAFCELHKVAPAESSRTGRSLPLPESQRAHVDARESP